MKITRLLIPCALLTAAAGAFAAGPKTVITGDRMEIIKGGKIVVFSGNSKVSRGENTLKADRIVHDKKSDRVEAIGSVDFTAFTQDKEPIRATAGQATYNPSIGRGELFSGRPQIVYRPKASSGPMKLVADAIQFDEKAEEMYARGDVEVLTSSGCAYSPAAVFMQKERKVVLTGTKPQPRIDYFDEGGTSRYCADRITVFTAPRRILLEGNVKSTVVVKDNVTKGGT